MSGKDLVLYTEPMSSSRREAAPGLLRSGVHQFQAWCEERTNDAEVRRLASQKRLLLARQELMEAEAQAQRAVHTAAANAEEAASDRAFRRTLRTISPREAYHLLHTALEEETLLLQREQLRRHRLAAGTLALPEGAGRPVASQDSLEIDLSAQQIERLALRAVTQFQILPEAERAAAAARWRQELEAKFPAYAVAEITRRAEELQALL